MDHKANRTMSRCVDLIHLTGEERSINAHPPTQTKERFKPSRPFATVGYYISPTEPWAYIPPHDNTPRY